MAAKQTGPMSPAEIYALPASVDIPNASRALGISRDTGYRLVRTDEFPVHVLRIGRTLKVARSAILEFLGLPATPDQGGSTQAGAA